MDLLNQPDFISLSNSNCSKIGNDYIWGINNNLKYPPQMRGDICYMSLVNLDVRDITGEENLIIKLIYPSPKNIILESNDYPILGISYLQNTSITDSIYKTDNNKPYISINAHPQKIILQIETSTGTLIQDAPISLVLRLDYIDSSKSMYDVQKTYYNLIN